MGAAVTGIALSWLALIACAHAPLARGRSTVIPAQNSRSFAVQCSRPDPPAFESAWEPSAAQVQRLEARLRSLEGKRAKACCLVGGRFHDLNAYWRQYVGIVVTGRRLIYINAFSVESPREHWQTEAVIICDGGETAWGAVYDPTTDTLSDFSFNGV